MTLDSPQPGVLQLLLAPKRRQSLEFLTQHVATGCGSRGIVEKGSVRVEHAGTDTAEPSRHLMSFFPSQFARVHGRCNPFDRCQGAPAVFCYVSEDGLRLTCTHSPHIGDALHVCHETCEQRGPIVLSPGERQLLRQVHIDHGQNDDALGSVPTRGCEDPSYSQAGRNQAEDRRLVLSLLNDSGGLQTTTKTFAHQAVVERGG